MCWWMITRHRFALVPNRNRYAICANATLRVRMTLSQPKPHDGTGQMRLFRFS